MGFQLDTQELKRGLVIFTHDAEIQFRIKHGIPVFDKTFAQVADEFSTFQKERSDAGEITFHRWRVMQSHIKTQLKPYVGTIEITLLGEERWKAYPTWRQKNGEGRSGGRVRDGTIRDEMATFRAIMSYAASKKYVAASNVAVYLDRIRGISKHTQPSDHVFCTEEGGVSRTLYYSLVERLLIESGLQKSSSGSRRSTYCFRHTYATFRLTEGVDVYFLAKQMGTSVKMIEDHYGHITPVKNADRILLGLPGWQAGQPEITSSG